MRSRCRASVRLLLALLLAAAPAAAQSSANVDAEPVVTLRSNIVFTPAAWPEPLAADLYRPVACLPCPVVMLVHGGGWTGGHRQQMARIARSIAASGYAAFTVDYRLAPRFAYPAPVDDLVEAMKWLQGKGPLLGLDAQRVALWGYSAGAQLALLASLREELAAVRALVVGGLPADLRALDPIAVSAHLGDLPAAVPERASQASPLLRVDPRLPPVFMYHAIDDEVVGFDQAERMKAALESRGVPVQLFALEQVGHAGAAKLPDPALRKQLRQFLALHLRAD
jgi:acetyl esterase/lipase